MPRILKAQFMIRAAARPQLAHRVAVLLHHALPDLASERTLIGLQG